MIKIKTSDLIRHLTDHILEFGDTELKIDLLTENQSNYVYCTGFESNKECFEIECDIEDVKGLKRRLK